MSGKLSVRALSDELRELARTNCNENSEPERTESNIVYLQTWIKKSPHLKARSDSQLLLSFLRRCKFSLQETKARIDAYYSLKNAFREVLCDRNVDEKLLELYRGGIHVIPSKPVSPCGPRVVVSQYSKYDPKKYNPRDAFKLLFMLLEMLAIEDDNASVAGIVYVVDARDATLEQLMQYDPFLLKKTYMLVDQCMPLKFNEIHLINIRREGQKVLSFVSNLLPSDKLPFKFVIHKKAEDLFNYLPPYSMPIEYGGHNGFQADAVKNWEQKLLEYENYFANDDSYGTEERLRVGLNNSLQVDVLEGVSGSFRKLEVD